MNSRPTPRGVTLRLLVLAALALCVASTLTPHASAVSPAQAPAITRVAAPTGWASMQEARLQIPSIGLDRAVFAGGQPTIDRGVVTHYVGAALPRTGPGGNGVYWLAAHNGSHGSPFLRVPYLRVGAVVRVTTRTGAVLSYRIHRRVAVGTRVPADLLYSGTGPRIVLQTCTGTTQRVLLFGQLLT